MCVVKCHFGSLMSQSLVGLHSMHHLQLCSFQLSICMFFHTYSSLIIFLFCSALSLAVLSLQHLIIGLQSSYSISIFTLPFASLYADLTDRCPPPLLLTADVSRTAVCLHCPRPPTSPVGITDCCSPPLLQTAVRRRYRRPLSAAATADCCLQPLPRAAS